VPRLVGLRSRMSSEKQAVYRYVNAASWSSVPTSLPTVTSALRKNCRRTALEPLNTDYRSTCHRCIDSAAWPNPSPCRRGPYSHLNHAARTHVVSCRNRAMNPQPLHAEYAETGGFIPLVGRRVQSPPAVGPGGAVLLRPHTQEVAASTNAAPIRSRFPAVRDRHRLGGAPLGIAVLGGLGPIGYRATLGDAATDGVPGRATRSPALWSSLGTSRGRPRRGSSTARAMLCSTGSGAAAPGVRGHRRAAMVDRERSRAQRPSVLREIRSQLWIV
jgi:hypothetical protein